MSVEAMSWAMNDAPVDDPNAAAVLIGLANHARADGTSAFPSVATLCRYTRLSERTVRRKLDELERAGLITQGSPSVVASHIDRADRRPKVYDLALHLTRGDGVSQRQAVNATGCHGDRNGVSPVHERGVTVTPEPYKELKQENTRANDTTFDEWWALYPRKVAKGQARRAHKAAAKKVDHATLCEATRRFARSDAAGDPQFIPYPATWLHGERWLDVMATASTQRQDWE
jgi:DNA-binding transcriptional ArsR family regulator